MGESNYTDAPIEEPLPASEGEVDATIPQGEIASDGGADAAEGESEGGDTEEGTDAG